MSKYSYPDISMLISWTLWYDLFGTIDHSPQRAAGDDSSKTPKLQPAR